MIVAIYFTEYPNLLPVDTIVPISRVEKTRKNKREQENKHSKTYKGTTKQKEPIANNYMVDDIIITEEQLFDRSV